MGTVTTPLASSGPVSLTLSKAVSALQKKRSVKVTLTVSFSAPAAAASAPQRTTIKLKKLKPKRRPPR